MWFPLSWSSGVPQIVNADVWNLNVTAGMSRADLLRLLLTISHVL